MIPLTRPLIGDEECAAVERVLRGGMLVHGEECEAFEAELASYLGVSDVLVVSSGTAALHLALLALGIGPGDAVLVPDFTFPATANVVERVGARPVLVDVDAATYNVTPLLLEQAITAWEGPERLRCMIPVHEFGCPLDMAGVMALARAHDLLVVEDAACALGTRCSGGMAGTFANAGCFSFHPRKSLTTGEGGAIAVDDPELAHRLRLLRNHGMQRGVQGMEFLLAGLNYRMTNFQAALGRVQLPKLDGWIVERGRLQKAYRAALATSAVSLPVEVDGHAWQTFMVVLPDDVARGRIVSDLAGHGIESNLGAQALHLLAHYCTRYQDGGPFDLQIASKLYRQGLALPLYPGVTTADAMYVGHTLSQCLEG